MQDLGPDMEELLCRASEEYPLKDPGDSWQAIKEAINSRQMESRAKRRYLGISLPPLLAIVMVLIGISIRDAGSRITGDEKSPLSDRSNTASVAPGKRILERGVFANQPVTNNTSVTFGKMSTSAMDSHRDIEGISSEPVELRPAKTFADVNEIHAYVNSQSVADRISGSTMSVTTSRTQAKRLYYGVLAGLEVNAIRNQPFGNSNFEIGLIAGYRLSRLLSIESGLSLVKKYYSTDGKYFDINDMGGGMPGGAEMMNVDGTSKIVRIPIHVRTEIMDGRNYKAFGSMGISSYIMAEQNNLYSFMMNGSEEKMTASYAKNRSYVAATADLSLGLERKIGSENQIRFQPYLQLPLKGIGIGKLPIKSAGIRIALTHNH
jgi:hypothetical protein